MSRCREQADHHALHRNDAGDCVEPLAVAGSLVRIAATLPGPYQVARAEEVTDTGGIFEQTPHQFPTRHGVVVDAEYGGDRIVGYHRCTVMLQVAAGRNLAVRVEAAVRNTILKLRGIDTLGEFMERQAMAILQSSK